MKTNLFAHVAPLAVVACLVSTTSAGTLGHFRFEETPLGVHNSWSNSEGPGPAGTSNPGGTISNTADVFGPVVPASGAANAASVQLGGSSWIDLGDNYDVGTGDFTVEFWMNGADDGANSFVMAKFPPSGKNGLWNFVTRESTTDSIGFELRNAAGTLSTFIEASSKVVDNQWHHVAGVVDRTAAQTRLYVDGQLEQSGSISAFNTDNIINNGGTLIGKRPTGNYFSGMVDELRISNAALDPRDFLLSGDTLGYYRFEETPVGYHATWKNSEGIGPKGVPNGATQPVSTTDTFGPMVPLTEAGNSASLVLDGNDAVSLGDNFDIGAGEFTVELWMKGDGGGSDGQMVVTKSGDSKENGWTILARDNVTGDPVAFEVRPSSGSVFAEGTTDVLDGAWHHVAAVITRDGGSLGFGEVKLYVDKILEDTEPLTSLFDGLDVDTAEAAWIGRRNHTSSPAYFTGMVDEVRFSRVALEPSQFLNHIPEPSTFVLLSIGMAAMVLCGYRQRRSG